MPCMDAMGNLNGTFGFFFVNFFLGETITLFFSFSQKLNCWFCLPGGLESLKQNTR